LMLFKGSMKLGEVLKTKELHEGVLLKSRFGYDKPL
jgi:hypothetical protein